MERVVGWMAELEIDAVAAVQKRGTYGFDNSYVLASAAKYSLKIAPVMVFDAQSPETLGALRQMAARGVIAGLRLTGRAAADGNFPWLNSPPALKTWECASECGMTVVIMVSSLIDVLRALDAITGLARTHPATRVVVDHAGLPLPPGHTDFGLTAQHLLLAQQPNVYVKVTTINFDLLREAQCSEPVFLQRLVALFGADRVLWGSDIGNSAGSYSFLAERARCNASGLGDAERRFVLRDTAASLFGPRTTCLQSAV